MQYISSDTSSFERVLWFTKPLDYDANTKLKFSSYMVNHEFTPSVSEHNHFVQVTFTASSAFLTDLGTGIEFEVQFGSGFDDVAGEKTGSSVIEYSR